MEWRLLEQTMNGRAAPDSNKPLTPAVTVTPAPTGHRPNLLTSFNKIRNAHPAVITAPSPKAKCFYSKKNIWRDFELVACSVSDHSMTYYQSQSLQKWNVDHVSLGDDPQQVMTT